ncbi:MAG TPA: aminopeptidase N [Candidatus Limnocylindria bacterium]|nr:aminopeptidase N [Candidatus Limnocylindria bacterium]
MPHTPVLTNPVAARDVLTESEAQQRAARVSDASYEIALDLVAGKATYGGDVTVRFNTTGSGPLFLDFRGREIERLEVNGERLDPDWTGYRLTVPAESVSGSMTVRIAYVNDYDTTGDGFHRFVDPEDGAEYVYTNFEPYEAHRLFPCFDQPDIKARYEFSVTAPNEWAVFSNAPTASTEPTADGRTHHQFARTELFSTYLTALIGGPYVHRAIEHNGTTMRLFARGSMERYLDDQAAEIFEVTTQGFDFYADLFSQPYAFGNKYDQVFVPEYNSGAMENVACVTYNEAYLFRDPPTDNQRLDRAETFLHELAHMWFGNLVTMRWWNDLWLNESFATYISYLAMTSATRFRNAWKVFNYRIKRWAYQTDQLPTTHPIAGTAADTEIAFLNFDGITYGKGASVLKQLAKYIGPEAFRDGLRLYFKRHGWQNATLAEFLACLEEAHGASLQEWAQKWLRTASLNTIAAKWEAADGKLASLAIEQSAPADYPTIRPHAFEIALVSNGQGPLTIETQPAWIEAALTDVPELRGHAAPGMVFPNHGDHAYAKVALDAQSLEFVHKNLNRVEDPLLRELLWMSLWEMVRDRGLRSTDYLAIARDRLRSETDQDILDMAVERTALAIARFVPESSRENEGHLWFETALANLAATNESDRQILWARSAVGVATTADDVAQLANTAAKDEPLNGFMLDQEMRWLVAIKAVAFGLPNADALLATEAARDRSDRGRRALLRAEASRPTDAAKAEAWERINADGYGSFHLTRAAMQGFYWPHQQAVLAPYADRFFDKVRGVFETRDHPFARSYLVSLYPAYRGEQGVLERSRGLLTQLNGSLPTLTRQLTEAADDLDRVIKVRAFAEKA